MSNWKNHAYLLANGKFKAKGPKYDFLIEGIMGGISKAFQSETSECFYIEGCTLIARPISDMSNSEVAKALSYQGIEHEGRDFGYFENLLFDIVNENYDQQGGYAHEITPLTAKAQNYLLSIGVYCLSDDTDVIFKPKTEQP